MRRICTICARGGSKGLKDKNVRPLAGRPLIAHTVAQALASGLFETVAVSSDAAPIRDAGLAAGAHAAVVRPPEFATDSAGKLPAVRHCVEEIEGRLGVAFDVMVDMDVTAPLRIPDDIAGAVRLLETSDAGNVITGVPARKSPYFNMVELDAGGFAHLPKPLPQAVVARQQSPKVYDMNASVYVWRRAAFFAGPHVFGPATRLFAMPESRAFDIDTELDFELVEFLFRRLEPEWNRTTTVRSST